MFSPQKHGGHSVRLRRIAHRETRPPRLSESDGGQVAMGKKPSAFGETITAYWHLDYFYAPASMLFVGRRLPRKGGMTDRFYNGLSASGKRKKYPSPYSLCLCGEIQLPYNRSYLLAKCSSVV